MSARCGYDAIDAACSRIEEVIVAEAAEALRAIVDVGARMLLIDPELAERILPGVMALPEDEGLAKARAAVAGARMLLAAGHWAGDTNVLLARMQLERALVIRQERRARRAAP